ncbi:MAG: CoA transferase [Desulfobacterales bacterium]|nr:CoA transferase [Desulfobacterales bacterium]
MMSQALSGIKVIDVASVLAGPYATMLLGDMGANVIKIEPPIGDMMRKSPPFIGGESAYYIYANRNKRGMRLNLKTAEGKEVLFDLVKDADIFIENWKPPTKRSLGIDYSVVQKINPKLIYCSISGFGQSGPWAERPGFDQIAQGMAGLMSVTGFTEPTRVGVAIGDSIASLFATYGILCALIEREKSGKGQFIETSLLEGLISVLGFQAAKYFGTKEIPSMQGNDHAAFSPYGTYKTKDGHINIAAGNEKMWLKLCELLEINELIQDSMFNTMEARVSNKDKLKEILECKLAKRTSAEWIEILNNGGIACGPIYSIDEVFNDEHVLHRKMLLETTHSLAGKIEMIGFPVKMKRTPCKINYPPPVFNEHTEEILKEIGYNDEKIVDLKRKEII